MAIGIGFDIHRLVPGRKLVLGGVEIDHPVGLLGHSDGDAVLHALVDAMLGASGRGDIGDRFPDDDPVWKGADSRELLRRVASEVAETWEVGNADITILAEEPKMAPHRSAMRACIAEILKIPESRVSVKAKTSEGLGAIGAREAIASFAAVQLEPK